MFTKAFDKLYPLLVVPSKALRKLTVGSGTTLKWPPRATRPGMMIIMRVMILVIPRMLERRSEMLVLKKTAVKLK